MYKIHAHILKAINIKYMATHGITAKHFNSYAKNCISQFLKYALLCCYTYSIAKCQNDKNDMPNYIH